MSLPIGTVEGILEAAPSDRVTETIEVPEWGCSVRIQSLSAADQAAVKQASVVLGKGDPGLAWAAMEKTQFQLGVVEPKFTLADVNTLHHKSGAGFARVIAALDRISNLNKEELRAARDDFPVADD